MRMNASVCAGVVAAVLSVVAAAPAQQPKVTNAQVSVRNGANLQQEIAAVRTPTWDAATRREAIFWLGQSKDPKALEYLEKVVKE